MSAVAIATPKMTLATVPFLARAMTKAKPPKNAINTSLISGLTLANNSEDSSRSGNSAKNKKDKVKQIETVKKTKAK